MVLSETRGLQLSWLMRGGHRVGMETRCRSTQIASLLVRYSPSTRASPEEPDGPPPRVKGRVELLMNLTSMIFPNGYTIRLPGVVQSTPGDAGTNGVEDREGTIAGDSGKEKDVGTIVRTAIPGAGIGAIADQGSGKGAAIGAASGGALGLATVLLTRGPEIHLGAGDSVEMVLERSLTIEQKKVNRVGQ